MSTRTRCFPAILLLPPSCRPSYRPVCFVLRIDMPSPPYCTPQVFEHGFYNYDPHAGNVIVMPDGRLGLVDYGGVSSD